VTKSLQNKRKASKPKDALERRANEALAAMAPEAREKVRRAGRARYEPHVQRASDAQRSDEEEQTGAEPEPEHDARGEPTMPSDPAPRQRTDVVPAGYVRLPDKSIAPEWWVNGFAPEPKPPLWVATLASLLHWDALHRQNLARVADVTTIANAMTGPRVERTVADLRERLRREHGVADPSAFVGMRPVGPLNDETDVRMLEWLRGAASDTPAGLTAEAIRWARERTGLGRRGGGPGYAAKQAPARLVEQIQAALQAKS
jgi:hypothetical protein